MRAGIDFDKLKDILAPALAEGQETYEFRWVGKSKAMREAGQATTKTLRPDLDESVDFDQSENVFITGDNLEALKILQESYLGVIDMIYIDPPYNTGKDFVYKDNFHKTVAEQDEAEGNLDEEGNRLYKNEKTNPRYHSDWLNMMYPRLVLARNLLKDSGVIFISIDDNEQANLKAICDEIFGEENFVADVIIDATPKNDPLLIATSHEYVLTYVKDRGCAKEKVWGYKHPLNDELNKLIAGKSSDEAMKLLKQYYIKNNLTKDNISNYKFVDEYGIFRTGPLDDPQSKGPKDARINLKTGNILKTPTRGWSCNIETWNKWVNENLIYFPSNDESLASKKTYLDSNKLETGRSVIKMQTRKSTNYLRDLFGKKGIFDNPKPIDLLKYFINLSTDQEMQILDFFAGSATTADAVMQLNAVDGGNRKYILCTLDEQVTDKSAAKEAGYETIDQISRERIRRAADKIRKEQPDKAKDLDLGFRAFRVDESNFRDVSVTPSEMVQGNLLESVDNIREDATALDLLFQVMLAWGSRLSLKISEQKLGDNTIYSVDEGSFIACFDDRITEETIRAIAQQKPQRAVFKDTSFTHSADKINLTQIFKEVSPETQVKVV